MDAKQISPFLGMNQRKPDFALATKDGHFVRDAVNVDVTNSGTFRVRDGQALIQAQTGAHSFFTNSAKAVLVRGGTLYRVTRSPYSETLLKVLSTDDAVSYWAHGADIYFSNGTDSGRIAEDNTVYPWAMPAPEQPVVEAIVGLLPAGKYQVALTYANATTGEEGAHVGSSNPELTTDGALRVTLPTGAVAGATHVNVYVSQTNGSQTYLHSSHAIGTASVDVTSLDGLSRPLRGVYEQALPAGGSLFIHMGRLCSVVGSRLWYGTPYRFGYCSPMGYIDFEGDIALATPNQFGTYVVASKTHWIPGDLEKPDGPIMDVLPYGGVPGTAFALPQNSLVGWFGAKGIVLADPQGQAEAVMTELVDVTPPATGCSTALESQGTRRVVSCGWSLNVENRALTRYDDWDFTSLSKTYGTKADGLYQIVPEASEVIQWSIDLGKHNFGTETLKHLPATYVGAASDAAVTLDVLTPTGDTYSYDARSYSDGLEVHRIDPGKGLRFNWYGLALRGEGYATIASVSFAPVASGRRV